MEELITVVMSAYNVQDTVEKAINSVLMQSYENLELIVVDDASTDNTKELIQKLVEKDSRVHLVEKAANEGAGMARRSGIEARSKDSRYLCFLDADDWLDKDYLETLYMAAKEYNADIVSGGLRYIDGDKVVEEKPAETVYLDHGGRGLQWVDANNPHAVYFRFLNLALMRSSLWNRVTYSGRRFLEDTPTMVKILYYANSRVMLPYVGYNYVQNSTSLCHTTNPKKRLVYTILSAAESTTFYKRHDEDAGDFLRTAFTYLKDLKNQGISEEERQKYKDELAEIAVFLLDNLKW